MARSFVSANNQRLEGTFSNVVHPITIACYFWDDSGAATERTMIQIQDTSQPDRFYTLGRQGIAANNLQIQEQWDGTVQTASQGLYASNQWTHAAGVFASTTSRTAYVNSFAGTEDTGTVGTPIGIDLISIGRSQDSTPDAPWSGKLAEVGVWDVALTQAEILSLAIGTTPKLIRPSALIFYAPMIQGTVNGDDRAIWVPNEGILTSNATTGEVGDTDHPRIQYPNSQILQFPLALTQDQDQFRFGTDDGNEAGHGWIAAQNVNISQAGSTAAILRIQVNNTGDAPSQQMKLQYKITAQADSEYRDVPVAP